MSVNDDYQFIKKIKDKELHSKFDIYWNSLNER